jgi:hypothetical protein
MLDIGPGFVVAVVAVAVALLRIFRGPIGEAIGDRMRGSVASPDPGFVADVDGLKARLAELKERLDFAERLLADGRQADQLPGRLQR